MSVEPEEDPADIQINTGWDPEDEGRYYIHCSFPNLEDAPDNNMAGFDIMLSFSVPASQHLLSVRDQLARRDGEGEVFAIAADQGGRILICAATLTAACLQLATTGQLPLAILMQGVATEGMRGLMRQLETQYNSYHELIHDMRRLVEEGKDFDRFIAGTGGHEGEGGEK